MFLRNALQRVMPWSLRKRFLRKFLNLDYEPSPRLKIKLARTKDELEAALKLLHDCYVRADFMDPHESGLRVTKYHALPSTSTIIATWDDEVVGTVSLIRRSDFGLPLEAIFDISHLTRQGLRVLETSALAIHPRFSGKHGSILFPMIKFMLEYSIGRFGCSAMTIAVNPAWIEFYQAIFGFKLLSSKPVESYAFVKGAPAVGAYLDLRELKADLKKTFSSHSDKSNLFKYIFEHRMENMEFPARKFSKISDPVLTPDIINYFFNQKTATFSTMSEREVFVLYQLYEEESYRKILPPRPPISNLYVIRNGTRLEMNFSGNLQVHGQLPISIFITDVSPNGLGAVVDRNLRSDEIYDLTLSIDGHQVDLKVKMTWKRPTHQNCGLMIIDPPNVWIDYISRLRNDLFQKAS